MAPTPQEPDTPIAVRAVGSIGDDTALLRIPDADPVARDRMPLPLPPLPLPPPPRRWARPGAAMAAEAADDVAIAGAVRTLGVGSRTVAVIGAKGGVGATTTALLAGALLAAVPEARPVLVELAADWGTTGQVLGAGDGPTVADLLAHLTAAHRGGLGLVQGFTVPWCRVPVLLAPRDPALVARLTPTDYARAHRLLAAHYGLVLLDCGPSLTHPLTRFALDVADHIVLVTGPDAAALHGAHTALQLLTKPSLTGGLASVALDRNPPRIGPHAPTDLTLVINGADATVTRVFDAPFGKEVMPTLNAVLTVPRSEPLRQQFAAGGASVETLPTPIRRALKTVLATILRRLTHV